MPAVRSLLAGACVLCAALVLCALGQTRAQDQPPAQQPEQGKKKREILVQCDEIVGVTTGEKDIWELRGNVEMRHEDAVMYADHAWWNREERTARLVDGVRIEHPDHVMTSDVCDVDFKKKIARFTGNVKIRTERKRKEGEQPAGEEDELTKYEYMVWWTTCDELIYNYDTDEGEARGNIESVSDDKKYHFYADVAYYRIERLTDGTEIEVIELPNNPLMKSTEGDTYQVSHVIIKIWPEDESGYRKKEVNATGVRILEVQQR